MSRACVQQNDLGDRSTLHGDPYVNARGIGERVKLSQKSTRSVAP
jgi:hypothetical protein